MTESRTIYCCACEADVQARLTDGTEVYPHRRDLWEQPFWLHEACGNYVSCHHKLAGKARTQPTGCIPTVELRNARRHVHRILDPLWQGDGAPHARKHLYAELALRMGKKGYHTGDIRTVQEARVVYAIVVDITRNGLPGPPPRQAAGG
jgi:zinc-finger-containing domain